MLASGKQCCAKLGVLENMPVKNKEIGLCTRRENQEVPEFLGKINLHD